MSLRMAYTVSGHNMLHTGDITQTHIIVKSDIFAKRGKTNVAINLE